MLTNAGYARIVPLSQTRADPFSFVLRIFHDAWGVADVNRLVCKFSESTEAKGHTLSRFRSYRACAVTIPKLRSRRRVAQCYSQYHFVRFGICDERYAMNGKAFAHAWSSFLV